MSAARRCAALQRSSLANSACAAVSQAAKRIRSSMAQKELTHALRFCSASVLASQCANQHSKPQRRYSCLTKSPTWEIWSDIQSGGLPLEATEDPSSLYCTAISVSRSHTDRVYIGTRGGESCSINGTEMGKGTVEIRLRLAVIQVQKHRFKNPGGRGRGRGTLNGLIEYLLYLANTQQIV